MKYKTKDSYQLLEQNKKLKYLFLGLFGLVILSLIFIFRFYLWPFLTALILYMAIRPLHERLQKLIKNRTLSSAILVIGIFVVILIPSILLMVSLADQTYQLYLIVQGTFTPEYFEKLQNNSLFQSILNYFNIEQGKFLSKATAMLQKTTLSTFTGITSVLTVPLNIIINFFFMVLMLFFLLKDGYKLDRAFYEILPFPDDLEKVVVVRLKEVIKILLAGNFLMMIVQGLMVGIGFYIAGLTMPLLWGSVAAVFSLIPVIGTTFIWVPAALYLGLSGEPYYAVFLSIWSFFWYIFLENMLKPKIFGDKLNFHPIVFFFLLLGSIKALNLPGIIVGPILLTLYYSFWEIYKILNNHEYEEEKIEEK